MCINLYKSTIDSERMEMWPLVITRVVSLHAHAAFVEHTLKKRLNVTPKPAIIVFSRLNQEDATDVFQTCGHL